jgi:glycosyltransferase involved in cell wall biosynthesis
MHRKRIALLGIQGALPGRYGGFETFAHELATRLSARNEQVTVYCEDPGGIEKKASFRGVHLEYIQRRRLGPLTTIVSDLVALWRARKGYDVVYMLGYGASLFCFIPRLWGAQVWINMDGVEWQRSKWNWLGRTWLKAMEAIAMWTPNRIIADAEGIKAHLARRHRRLPPCSVIPYGAPVVVDPPSEGLLAQWNLAARQYYLVVCRLEPENHVLEIIQGYVRSASKLPLVVVGNDSSGGEYVETLKRNADSRVRFIGTVFDVPKLQALRFHCTAYFHGHSVGGTNPSLLEALGCGNIVVAHDNVYNREVLGKLGRYFASTNDIPKFLPKVESLSEAERRQESEAARERVRSRYSWDKVVDEYVALLETIPARPL